MAFVVIRSALRESSAPIERKADVSLLERVPQLQHRARLSNSGGLGCGIGTCVVQTSRGRVSFPGWDEMKVFGSPIYLADMHLLLQERIAANEGQTTAMSGEVGDLGYVILLVVGQAKDPASIPFVEPLLKDPNGTIRGFAALALSAIRGDMARWFGDPREEAASSRACLRGSVSP